NIAIYSLDVRGLVSPIADGGMLKHSAPRKFQPVSAAQDAKPLSHSRLVLASYSVSGAPDPQRPGGGGGGAPSGGGRTGGGGGAPTAPGGGTGAGGRGGTGGTGGTGSTGNKGGTGGGTTGTPGKGSGTTGGTGTTGTRGGGTGATNYNNAYNNAYNNPYNQSRSIVPQFPPSVSTNQQVLAALAEGTGGFTIFNTNDLLGGLERI